MISIIIPVRDRPRLVLDALASARAQSGMDHDKVEIIIVDDASHPPLAAPSGYPNVHVVRLERNVGPAGARNHGILRSKGEYILFLDSDDLWLANKLTRQLAFFQNLEASYDRSLVSVVCGFYYRNRRTGQLETRFPSPAASVSHFAAGCWHCPGSTLLVHRSVFDRVGLLDERLRRLEDLEWFIRFGLRGGRLFVCPYVGAVIIPSGVVEESAVVAATRLLESKYGPGRDQPLSGSDYNKLRAYLELEKAAVCLMEGERLRAIGYVLRSLMLRPRSQMAVDVLSDRSREVPSDVAALHRRLAFRLP
jgi:glycosyltransferase involved in cell wall biosynthesis